MADIALILSKIKLYINHPIPGQLFADIFPIFRDPAATEAVISHICTHIKSTHVLSDISAIVCLEARGFFFGPIIASRLGLPCVPVRKTGKLPGEIVSVVYEKEYGPDSFAMKVDAFEGVKTAGKKVIVVDDLLGKGGSMGAAITLLGKLEVDVAECVFIFDIDIPEFHEAVGKSIGSTPRYAMVSLTASNMGEPVNA